MESLTSKGTKFARHLSSYEVTRELDDDFMVDSQPQKLSPHGLSVQKGRTFGQKKSSFSKKSSRSGDFDSDQEQKAKENTDDINSFLHRINGDFDRKKQYEETVTQIMNEMCRTKVTHPPNSEQFAFEFQNTSIMKRTIFLDVDDTLVYTSLYKLHDFDDASIPLDIDDHSGKLMKVNILITLSINVDVSLFKTRTV